MTHPLEQIHPARRTHYFYPLLGLTILLLLSMNFVGMPLNTAAAPQGIISFEFAATPERAQQMLDSWSPDARIRAGFIQGLDFLFPLVYSTTVGLGCVMAAGVIARRGQAASRLGPWLAWGLWAAAALDYVENFGLLFLLFGMVQSPYPQIAAVCAAIKFALLAVGLVYSFYGLSLKAIPSTA
jgi:hypothetical protein